MGLGPRSAASQPRCANAGALRRPFLAKRSRRALGDLVERRVLKPEPLWNMRYRLLAVACCALFISAMTSLGQATWQAELHRQLPLLGHRNWIVIADSAYPLQTAAGIETLTADADQLDVLHAVLTELGNSKHVKPIVYTDAELKFVPESRARGIADYRTRLNKELAGHSPQELPHEKIIAKLDEAGKTFKVLLIKTRLTLPYTSVFLQLDCAYWTAESEKELRASIAAAAKK
jgi:L-fucose mutarotase/ribose pyranase (RbsD/FucU family)